VGARDLLDGRERRPGALVAEALRDPRGARPLRVARRVAAVLAGQEARGERGVRRDADPPLEAEVLQAVLIARAVEQVVARLQDAEAGEAALLGDPQRLAQPVLRVVRRPDRSHEALAHELVEGAQRLLERRREVVVVRVVEVEALDAEARERSLRRPPQRIAAQVARPAGLRRDHDVRLPGSAVREPRADERLRLPAGVAVDPGGVGVGGVDEVAARRHVGVEHREGLLAVDRPAEDVAAEAERVDGEAGRAEGDARGGHRGYVPRGAPAPPGARQLASAAMPAARRSIAFDPAVLTEVERLAGASAGDLSAFVNAAVLRELRQHRTRETTDRGAGIAHYREEYLGALLDRDARRARGIAEVAVEHGVALGDLYAEVFQPALERVGHLWAMEEINVAQEHFATTTTQVLLASLAPALRSEPTEGRLAIVSSTPGELHGLGAQMAADLLERAGWEVMSLGAATPATDLVELVEMEQPDVVALSASTAGRLPGVEQVLARLTALDPRPFVVVGGPLFTREAGEHASALGADLLVSDVRELVPALRERFPLVEEEPDARTS